LPARWGRPLAVTIAVVFCISSVFPAAAGLTKDTSALPDWWGRADVGIAFLLAALVLALVGITHGGVDSEAEQASYRAYRILIHGLLVGCVLYMLFGDHIVLPQCLPGFAWRAWLLLYLLPAWFTALRGKQGLPAVTPSGR
jgi:hypothetical protein